MAISLLTSKIRRLTRLHFFSGLTTLSNEAKARVRADFGMEDQTDRITIPTRHAFMWILKKKWFIDTRSLEEIEASRQQQKDSETKPRYFKFRLTNRDTANYYDNLVKEALG